MFFSTENFARDAKEVGYLMDLFANNFRTIAEEMNERDCQVTVSAAAVKDCSSACWTLWTT